MARVNRSVRWEIPFRGLSGDYYFVRIYDENWDGGVTVLTGMDVPIEIEEENSPSLLTLFRYGTGNLHLLEESLGGLDSLIPEDDFSRYVELSMSSTYGGSERLLWFGYMQSNAYESDFCEGLKGISFPLSSPLALLESIEIVPHSLISYSLNDLLGIALSATNVINWDYVYFPEKGVSGLAKTVHGLSFAPFNGNYTNSSKEEGMQKVNPYRYILEGICHAFGWLVHEVGSNIVFTDWGYDGAYYAVAYANLHPSTWSPVSTGVEGSDVLDFDEYFEITGTDNRQRFERGLRYLSLNMDGEVYNSVSLSWDRFRFLSYESMNLGHDGDGNETGSCAAWLESEIGEVSSPYMLQSPSITTEERIPMGGVAVANCGTSSSHEEKILFCFDPDWLTADYFLSVVLWNPPSGQQVDIKVHFQWGKSIGTLGNKEYVGSNIANWEIAWEAFYYNKMPYVYTFIYLDDVLYAATSTDYHLSRIASDGTLHILSKRKIPFCHKMELRFRLRPHALDNQGFTPGGFFSIDKVYCQSWSKLFSEYSEKKTTIEKLSLNANSIEDGSLTLPFTWYRHSANLIGDEVETSLVQDYSWLGQTRKVIEASCRLKDGHSLVWSMYVKRWLIGGKHFRLVSAGVSYRDERYRLLFEECPELVEEEEEAEEEEAESAASASGEEGDAAASGEEGDVSEDA